MYVYIGQVNKNLDDLNHRFIANNSRFYFDYKNGKYGYNTDPNRGADSFRPFSQYSQEQYDANYNNGYNAGYNAGKPIVIWTGQIGGYACPGSAQISTPNGNFIIEQTAFVNVTGGASIVDYTEIGKSWSNGVLSVWCNKGGSHNAGESRITIRVWRY